MTKLYQLILLFGFGFQLSVQAQIDVSVAVAADNITLSYEPKSDYNAAPYNLWNSQLLTVRYPDNFNLTWENLEQLSDFSWECDPLTPAAGVDGGDGYIYKTFYSANTPMINLNKDAAYALFKISFLPAGAVPLEIVSSGNWIKENSMELAINSAVTGNEFGEIVTNPVATSDLTFIDWEAKNIYPVPTEQLLFLEINSRSHKEAKAIIYNLKGDAMRMFSLSIKEGQNTLKIDVSQLAAGAYHIIIDNVVSRSLQFEKI